MADDAQDTSERRTEGSGVLFDRRHLSLPAVIAIFTLILQLGALVWGAATLKAAVEGLGITAKELQTDMRTLQSDVGILKVDVGVLKAREAGK